jgi:hypothetical protein
VKRSFAVAGSARNAVSAQNRKRVNVSFTQWLLSEVFDELAKINAKLDSILSKETTIMAVLDDIVAKVTAVGTVEDSVITLLTQIKAQLVAAGQDPVKLQALSDALDAQKTKLAAAVTANT